jgi:HEAT repeat protein
MSDDSTRDNAIAILNEKAAAIQTRLDALFELVQHYTPENMPLFQAILDDKEESAQLRSAVALSIGKVSGQSALEVLAPHVKTENPVVRSYVLQALGMTQCEGAMPFLIEALKDTDNSVFASASEAISAIGRPAVPYLIDLLETGAHDARCIAAWNLGELREEKSLPNLLLRIQEDESIEVIALSIWAIGQIGAYSEDVIQTLRAASQRPEPDVRLRADVALKKVSHNFN